MEPVWVSGSRDIGKCIGEGKNQIKRLVEQEGLPARKIFKKWRAIYSDLEEWAEMQMNGAVLGGDE